MPLVLLFYFLPFYPSSLVWAQPHDGYIRVNGQVLMDFNQYIEDGYPNAVNDQVNAPVKPCLQQDSTQSKVAKKAATAIAQAPAIDPEVLKKAYEAKKKLEEEITTEENVFEDLDTFFLSITDAPPPNCGYKLHSFAKTQVQAICHAMDDLANGVEIRESARCHVSNCSTASYLGIIQTLRTRPDWPTMQKEFTCKSPFPKAYLTYVGSNGLRKFAQEYNLGETRRISLPGDGNKKAAQLAESFSQGWPKKSDPILLQRDKTKSHTAHAVIFSHFESEDGAIFEGENSKKITKVCYWSSNLGTKGTANRCEPISYMSFIDSARLRP